MSKKTFRGNNASDAVGKLFTNTYDDVVYLPTDEIKTSEPFISLFPIREEVLLGIVESMRVNGFDVAQPLIVWKGHDMLIDGHTRLRASKEADIKKVPVIHKEFETVQDVLNYMYRVQFNRRNIKDSELITLVQKSLKEYQQVHGDGGKAEYLSKIFTGVSKTNLKRMIVVLDKATPEQIQSIIDENATVNAVYNTIKEPRPTDTDFVHMDKVTDTTPKGKSVDPQSDDDDFVQMDKTHDNEDDSVLLTPQKIKTNAQGIVVVDRADTLNKKALLHIAAGVSYLNETSDDELGNLPLIIAELAEKMDVTYTDAEIEALKEKIYK